MSGSAVLQGRKRSQHATPSRRFSLDKNPKLPFQEDPSTEVTVQQIVAHEIIPELLRCDLLQGPELTAHLKLF